MSTSVKYSDASEWVDIDAQEQLNRFHTNKRPDFTLPDKELFTTTEVYQEALRLRKYVCNKPEHQGNRILSPGEFNDKGGKSCKKCKAAATKKNKDAKRATLPPPVVYDTAEAFMHDHAKTTCEKHPSMTIGYCPKPQAQQFHIPLEFERAMVLREAHDKEYHRQMSQLDECKDRANDMARERYADKKNTQAGRQQLQDKTTQDQHNKALRMEAPIPEGMGRCPVGPHLAPEADFVFCPEADLNMTEYNGTLGPLRRTHCSKHFVQSVERSRRNHEKEECLKKDFFYNQTNDPGMHEEMMRNSADYAGVPEKMKMQQISEVKHQAKRAGFEYNISEEKENEMFDLYNVCYFCNEMDAENRILGCNRIDLSLGWTDENVISSCKICIYARNGLSVDDFKKVCNNVATFQTLGIPADDKMIYKQGTTSLVSNRTYAHVKGDAKRHAVAFGITHEDFQTLASSPCYLCGVSNAGGIDQTIAGNGYTIENAYPCCTACNFAKNTTPFEIFVAKCKKISQSS